MEDGRSIPNPNRGRQIVRTISAVPLVLLSLGWLLGLFVSIDVIREHGLNNPGLVDRGFAGAIVGLIPTVLFVAILVFLYREHEWARWGVVALCVWRLAVIVVGPGAIPDNAWDIGVLVLMTAIAAILVFSRDVRAFYRFRRENLHWAPPGDVEQTRNDEV